MVEKWFILLSIEYRVFWKGVLKWMVGEDIFGDGNIILDVLVDYYGEKGLVD